ncbi:hypothetical protein MIR68_006504 [Amoeboaphelidium protococcarum]|nr:hypothetical protein MIR68_006504 [Amoeboaphelidium protococcarum]
MSNASSSGSIVSNKNGSNNNNNNSSGGHYKTHIRSSSHSVEQVVGSGHHGKSHHHQVFDIDHLLHSTQKSIGGKKSNASISSAASVKSNKSNHSSSHESYHHISSSLAKNRKDIRSSSSHHHIKQKNAKELKSHLVQEMSSLDSSNQYDYDKNDSHQSQLHGMDWDHDQSQEIGNDIELDKDLMFNADYEDNQNGAFDNQDPDEDDQHFMDIGSGGEESARPLPSKGQKLTSFASLPDVAMKAQSSSIGIKGVQQKELNTAAQSPPQQVSATMSIPRTITIHQTPIQAISPTGSFINSNNISSSSLRKSNLQQQGQSEHQTVSIRTADVAPHALPLLLNPASSKSQMSHLLPLRHANTIDFPPSFAMPHYQMPLNTHMPRDLILNEVSDFDEHKVVSKKNKMFSLKLLKSLRRKTRKIKQEFSSSQQQQQEQQSFAPYAVLPKLDEGKEFRLPSQSQKLQTTSGQHQQSLLAEYRKPIQQHGFQHLPLEKYKTIEPNHNASLHYRMNKTIMEQDHRTIHHFSGDTNINQLLSAFSQDNRLSRGDSSNQNIYHYAYQHRSGEVRMLAEGEQLQDDDDIDEDGDFQDDEEFESEMEASVRTAPAKLALALSDQVQVQSGKSQLMTGSLYSDKSPQRRSPYTTGKTLLGLWQSGNEQRAAAQIQSTVGSGSSGVEQMNRDRNTAPGTLSTHGSSPAASQQSQANASDQWQQQQQKRQKSPLSGAKALFTSGSSQSSSNNNTSNSDSVKGAQNNWASRSMHNQTRH